MTPRTVPLPRTVTTHRYPEFIQSTIKGIEKGLEGKNFSIVEPIKFNVAVVNIEEGGGGIKLYVVDAGGKYKAEEITKIQFEIQPDINNFA